MNYATLVVKAAVVLAIGLLSGCASETKPQPVENEFGTDPKLVEPDSGGLPTINPIKAVGWPEGAQPLAAAGLAVNAFARDLEHPRWLLVLPNDDVLVAETDSPPDSSGISGIKGWIAGKIMAYAGSGKGSADRITLLRDTDNDGVADLRRVVIDDLYSPFGMALHGESLFVANADALLRFSYSPSSGDIGTEGKLVAKLPGETMNHHWTKNVIASPDGETLYVAVGSNSNIGENGMDKEVNRAAILAIDSTTGGVRVFAGGLRNPVGMDWEPETGVLWTVVNERDELGNQLVPDYLTEVENGAFYGWPYSYWGDNVDTRVSPQRPELVASARAPDYALGAHTASLGLAFYDHSAISWLSGTALVGQHGSWNREPASGYKVIAVPFEQGKPSGPPVDVLEGFLSLDGQAYGRPVGVALDSSGAILVADDAGNTIWRVAAKDE